jgi:hypothetical protein
MAHVERAGAHRGRGAARHVGQQVLGGLGRVIHVIGRAVIVAIGVVLMMVVARAGPVQRRMVIQGDDRESAGGLRSRRPPGGQDEQQREESTEHPEIVCGARRVAPAERDSSMKQMDFLARVAGVAIETYQPAAM